MSTALLTEIGIINLIDEAYQSHGMEATVEMLDKIKDLGFQLCHTKPV